ncbi:MAG: hypothetical protein H0T42_16605 [Deltaproteobacteria bacterium]|nr:hypothetical protein [Deltaproteobacteria bacterium]
MRWLITITLLAACGDDGVDPDSCQPAGTSEGPWVRAAQISVGTMHALVFDEVAGACGEVATTGERLVLLMCEPPEEKNYRVVPEQSFRCPGNEVLALVERDGGTDEAKAISGTLEIESVTGCVRGSYSVTLPTLDMLEASFDAVVCN